MSKQSNKQKKHKYTDEEINNLLENYIEVDDITFVPLNTHIRYFTIEIKNNKAKKVFKMGGNLIVIDPEKRFVVLKNDNIKWSVQITNTIFYREKNIDDIIKHYEKIIVEYENEILELKRVSRKLYEKLTGQKLDMKSIKDKYKHKHDVKTSESKPKTHKSPISTSSRNISSDKYIRY